MTSPTYQDIGSQKVLLLASHDGAALVRLIAGDLDGHRGPGMTHTPIIYTHVSLSPETRLEVPWRPDFNALAYVLSGRGSAGPERVPITEGQLVVFGPGDAVVLQADSKQESGSPALEALLIGGQPIREPTVFYGPFVMNAKEEIQQAVTDYRAGRLGTIPAEWRK